VDDEIAGEVRGDLYADEFDNSDGGQLGAVRFDRLTPTQFEEFCFDLLSEVGFTQHRLA
jgi:hypothetical protein